MFDVALFIGLFVTCQGSKLMIQDLITRDICIVDDSYCSCIEFETNDPQVSAGGLVVCLWHHIDMVSWIVGNIGLGNGLLLSAPSLWLNRCWLIINTYTEEMLLMQKNIPRLTHWLLGDLAVILKTQFSDSPYRLTSWVFKFAVKLP